MDEEEYLEDSVDMGFEEYCEAADLDLYGDDDDYELA